MSRASPRPRSGELSKAVMVGVIGRLVVIAQLSEGRGMDVHSDTFYSPNIARANCDTRSPIGIYHSLRPIIMRNGHDTTITRRPTT